VDCGSDAYIRLAGGGEEMICAHCFDARARSSPTRDADVPHAAAPVATRASGRERPSPEP
jgi:hypothetical protein